MAGAQVPQVNMPDATIYDIRQELQGEVTAFWTRMPTPALKQQLLNAIASNDAGARLAWIGNIPPEVLDNDARRDLISLQNLVNRPAPPAAVVQPTVKETPRLAIAQAHAHFNAHKGMYAPQIANLLQASFDQNTLAAFMATLIYVVGLTFPDMRIIGDKAEKALVDLFCIRTWIWNPKNFSGAFAETARALLKPKDDLTVPMDEQGAKDFMFKVLGSVTEPFIAEYLERHIGLIYKKMENGDFGEEKLSRSQFFTICIEFTLDKILNKVIPADEDILVFFAAQFVLLQEKLPKEIEKIARLQVKAENREMKRQIVLLQIGLSAHTRLAAVLPGPGTQPTTTTRPATATIPGGWELGGTKNPVQPQGPFPVMPPGLAYPDQPCLAWVGKYCTNRCKKGRPHDWGSSTPAQKASTEAHARLVKPHNVYNIWKSWVDNSCIPENFPHRITN